MDIYYGLCWGADITGSETLRTAAFQPTDRMIAGLFFSGLYLLRGFGITAWTHALYDVLVLLVLQR